MGRSDTLVDFLLLKRCIENYGENGVVFMRLIFLSFERFSLGSNGNLRKKMGFGKKEE